MSSRQTRRTPRNIYTQKRADQQFLDFVNYLKSKNLPIPTLASSSKRSLDSQATDNNHLNASKRQNLALGLSLVNPAGTNPDGGQTIHVPTVDNDPLGDQIPDGDQLTPLSTVNEINNQSNEVPAPKRRKVAAPAVVSNSISDKNLCRQDWIKTHDGGMEEEFKTYWNGLSEEEIKIWKQAAKVERKARKERKKGQA